MMYTDISCSNLVFFTGQQKRGSNATPKASDSDVVHHVSGSRGRESSTRYHWNMDGNGTANKHGWLPDNARDLYGYVAIWRWLPRRLRYVSNHLGNGHSSLRLRRQHSVLVAARCLLSKLEWWGSGILPWLLHSSGAARFCSDDNAGRRRHGSDRAGITLCVDTVVLPCRPHKELVDQPAALLVQGGLLLA